MTKDWEFVRAEVCRLYHEEGKSLSQVRSILLRERKFEASVRAFRSKVKEWKLLKKNEAAAAIKEPRVFAHHNSQSFSTPSQMPPPSPPPAQPYSGYCSPQVAPTKEKTIREALEEQFGLATSQSPPLVYHTSGFPVSAQASPVSHYASSARSPTGILSKVPPYFMDRRSCDACGRTALKIAIEAGQFENARLLVNASADVLHRHAHSGVFETFLERAWPDLSRSNATEQTAAARCFDLFISKGCWYSQGISIPSICNADCEDLVDLAAYHAPSMLPWDMIVQSAGQEELMRTVLRPCRHRCRKIGAQSPSELLRDLCARGYRHDAKNFNALSYVLNHAPDDEKAALMSTLLDLTAVGDVHMSDFDDGTPFDNWVHIMEPLKWQLAEILLSQDEGIRPMRPGESSETPDCVFVWHPGKYYNQYTTQPYDDHLFQLVKYASYISDAKRCVLHVLTKALIEDTVPEPKAGTRRTRCLDALKIRKQFGLPDIPVDTTFLIEVFEGGD